MSVAIINYGMGNLGSVRRAFAEIGAEAFVAEAPNELAAADRIVLPGVGSFGEGMARLNDGGWTDEIRHQALRARKPFLGICLGMQLLAQRGREGGDILGLDLIQGSVERLDALGCRLRVPHVGWNSVSLSGAAPLFEKIPSGTDFYFVHSYAFKVATQTHVTARVEYGASLVAGVAALNIVGVQFHPEKSSKAGFALLRSFMTMTRC
jgi:glutamine amidotransferase